MSQQPRPLVLAISFSFLVHCALLLFAPVAQAQADTGTIAGSARDSLGAIIAKAKITITNIRTNQIRVIETNAEGVYRAPLLPVGEYRVVAEATGFKRTVREKIALEINQTVRADFSLSVGQINEEVVITYQAPLAQSESATVGTVIDNKKVVELPLNGRSFLQLNLLVAGAVSGAEGSFLSTIGGAINVNGARETSNNFLLDGIDNNDLEVNQFVISPSIDAIQEFQLQSSTYSSEFGRSGGAQINIAIKSGANSFHGTAFEFLRNARLDAKNFFDPHEQKIPQFQRNQFGGTLGGPIRKDHTFFFFNYEGTRIRQAITRLARVPTVAEKGGDFSRTDLNGDGKVDANDALFNPVTGQPFPGNKIPLKDQDPIGAAIAKFFPDPNRSDPAQNFVSVPVLRDDLNHVNVRVDHRFSPQDTFFARYSFADEDLFNPFDPLSDPTNLPGFGTFWPTRTQSIALSYTHVFSAALINEFRSGYNRRRIGLFPQNQGNDVGGKLGIPGLPRDPRSFGFPEFNIIGFDKLAEPHGRPQDNRNNTYQVIDTLTPLRGEHALKFGADLRHYQTNVWSLIRGVFIFAPAFTGNSLGDLLLGMPVVTVNFSITNDDFAFRTTAYNFFAQDDLKVSHDLTLNLGLRYEYNQPPVEIRDRGAIFDFGAKSLIRLGADGTPRSGFEPDYNDVAPRIGFAWQARGHEKTVLRGGYGVFYDLANMNTNFSVVGNPPFFQVNVFNSSPASILRLNNPFPRNALAPGVVSPSTLDRHLRGSYLQHWSFNAQREVAPNLALDAGYVGSKGTKLIRTTNPNMALPGTDPNVNARRPTQQFGDIYQVEASAASIYHAFQLRVEKRFSEGLSFLAAYTWSKSIDDTSSQSSSRGDQNFAQNQNNLRAERGLSNFDVRHRFTVSYIYELPFGKEKKLFNQSCRWVKTMVADWQLSGIVAMQNGQPFTPQVSIDNSGTGQYRDRPNIVGNPQIDQPGPDGWFNTKAFAVSTPGAFGNAGRNILTGPSFRTIDFSVFKSLQFTERRRLQFRTEFFNLFNHPNFNLPRLFIDQPTAGKISTAKASRQIQFALKYIF